MLSDHILKNVMCDDIFSPGVPENTSEILSWYRIYADFRYKTKQFVVNFVLGPFKPNLMQKNHNSKLFYGCGAQRVSLGTYRCH